ncbi:MAG: CARDB domain-containing protein [Thermoplasmata archaeon]
MARVHVVFAIVLILLISTQICSENYNQQKDGSKIDTHTKDITRIGTRNTHPNQEIPWPMFGRDAIHSSLGDSTGLGIISPKILYDNGMSITSTGSTVGNFSKNVELSNASSYDRCGISAVFSIGLGVNITEIGSWKTIWQCNLSSLVRATPSLADLDGNGKLDIVVACMNGSVFAYTPKIKYEGNGNYSWNSTNNETEYIWHVQLDSPVTYSSPSFYDVNGDSKLDVIIGAGSKIYALNGSTGSELWKCTLNGDVRSTPAPLKYTETTNWTIATAYNATSTTYYAYWINSQGLIAQQKSYVLSGSLFVPVNFASIPFPSPSIVNLINETGEQTPEVVIAVPFESGIGRVYVYYAKNYTLAWEYSTYPSEQFYSTPSWGDVDNDGNIELVVITSYIPLLNSHNFNVYVLKGNGTLLWRYVSAIAYSQYVESTPALIDFDEDSKPDILVPCVNGLVFALRGIDGEVLWTTTLGGIRTIVFSSPAVGDFTNDGFVDIVLDGALITHKVIDLQIGPIDITPSPANEFDTVMINAIVLNIGDVKISNINVTFYDEESEIGNYTIQAIEAGFSTSAQCEWVALGGGIHNISVKIDPNNEIKENSEENNNASTTLLVNSHYGVSLSTSPLTYVVNPGVLVQASIQVSNTGDVNDTYNLTLTGLPSSWTATLSAETITLNPQNTSFVILSIAIPSNAFAVTHTVNITARSQNNTNCVSTISITIIVRDQFLIELTPTFSSIVTFAGKSSTHTFNFTVKNAGNAQDTINITVSNIHLPGQGWNTHLSTNSLILVPGGYANVSLTVDCPSNTIDGDYAEFLINASSTNDPSKNASSVVRIDTVFPDLTLRNLTFYRADGTQITGGKHLVAGEQATISFEIGNVRNALSLDDVMVRVSINNTPLVTLAIGTINAFEFKQTIVSWYPNSHGDYVISILADPLNTISEYNESNNELNTTLHVKDKSSNGIPFFIFGLVKYPNGIDAAVDCNVNVTNLRTNEELSTTTDQNGYYIFNLSNFASSYQDGDSIKIFAIKDKMFAERTVLVYSEDLQTRIDLLLAPIDSYSFYFSGNESYSTITGPIIAELKVTNNCSKPNLIEISTLGITNGWNLQISETSTFNPNTPNTLRLLVEGKATKPFYIRMLIPQNTVGGTTQSFVISAVSLNDTLETNTFNIEVKIEQFYSVKVEFLNLQREFFIPGETFTCYANISNKGNVLDSFSLSLAYPSSWTAAFDPPITSISISPFTYEIVSIAITVSPTAPCPSNGIVSITATSENNSSVSSTSSLTVRVDAKRFGVNLGLQAGESSSKTALPAEKLTFNLLLENTGNWADIFSITVSGASTWTYEFTSDGKAIDASRINLSAGSKKSLQFSITPPNYLDAESATSTIILTGLSQSDVTKSSLLYLSVSINANQDLAIFNVNTGNSLLQENKTITIYAQISTCEFRVYGAKVVLYVDGFYVTDRTFDIPESSVAQSYNISIDWLAVKGTHKVMLKLVLGEKVADPTIANNVAEMTIVIKGKTTKDNSKNDYSGVFYALIAIVLISIVVYFLRREKPKPKRKTVTKKDEDKKTPERKTKPRDPTGGLTGLEKL